MKKLLFVLLSLMLLAWGLLAHEDRTLDRSFAGIKTVEVNLVSGDCKLRAGAGDTVKVHLEYSYADDRYKPVLEAQGDRLVIREEFLHSGSDDGEADWTLDVPKNAAIKIHAASGDLDIAGLGGAITLDTASGDIELEDISGELSVRTASGDVSLEHISAPISVKTASGDIHGRAITAEHIELSLASGDIDLSDCRGGIEMKTASGDIQVHNLEITRPSTLQASSGDITVVLAKSPSVDLTLAAASGDVHLNYNGQPLQGYFECKVKKNGGDISSAIAFDKEEEVLEHGQQYIVKSFTRKSSTPRILLRTASGDITLSER